MRSAVTFLCLSAATVVALPTPSFASAVSSRTLAERHKFDIPAQGLSSALRSLSVQSGVRILFPYDEAAQYKGRTVHGWLSTDEALTRLIAGTPLRLAMASDGVIAIAAGNGRAASAQRASVTRFADASAASSVSAMLAASAMVPAMEAPDPAPAEPIIVTGTRSSNRTVAESLAPIDVLGKNDLQANGKQSVRDLLGALVPSISVSNSGAGASFAVKTLSLRGLSGDQLLVLVNGKRRHNTATLFINGTTQNGQSPPDLDLIPANAIERIEVLRDGASAQYGSDAIAGVVNIILKNDYSGGASALFGANGDGGGLTSRMQADYGFALGDGGHLHLSADGYMQGRTIRGTANTSQFYDKINGQPDPREATVNRFVNKPGQPQAVGGNLAYDASLPIGESVELYSFGTASKRHADSWLTFRNPNAVNNIPEIYPEGYIPHLHVHDKDFQVAGGLRGDGPAGVHFDLSTTYAENKVDYDESTALNASMGPASPTGFYIGYVKGTEWTSNLDLNRKFDLGLAEPLFVAAGAEYRENSYTIGAGEPASYIDGGYRSTTGSNAGKARASGSQGVTGFLPDSAGTFHRHSWSAYLNLEQTIVHGFDIALAGRHEDYSDFGTTDTGKVSVRIEPVKGIALRGTASTGFRAPTMQQQHYASASTIGVVLPGATTATLVPVRALPVNDPVAIALGSQPLKPEKSTNYSAGLVLTPLRRLNITVDAYQISIRDRILLSGTLNGSPTPTGGLNPVATILQNAGLNPFQSGFYFSNAASTRTRGLDIVSTYKADFGGLGTATFSLSGNFNKTKFTRLDVPAVLAQYGLALIDRARQGDFTKGMPRNKFIANVLWNVGPFSANVRATRYGEVTQVAAAKAADGIYHDDTIRPKVIFDLDLTYEVHKGVKLGVGANNLFNIYPTTLDKVNQGATGFSYYNPYSPYGFSGGFYYGKLNLSF